MLSKQPTNSVRQQQIEFNSKFVEYKYKIQITRLLKLVSFALLFTLKSTPLSSKLLEVASNNVDYNIILALPINFWWLQKFIF